MTRQSLGAAVASATLLLAACGNAGTGGGDEVAADGQPVTKSAEAQAERLETEAILAEQPMSSGGTTATQAEQAGAKLDAEADAVREAGEAKAGAPAR